MSPQVTLYRYITHRVSAFSALSLTSVSMQYPVSLIWALSSPTPMLRWYHPSFCQLIQNVGVSLDTTSADLASHQLLFCTVCIYLWITSNQWLVCQFIGLFLKSLILMILSFFLTTKNPFILISIFQGSTLTFQFLNLLPLKRLSKNQVIFTSAEKTIVKIQLFAWIALAALLEINWISSIFILVFLKVLSLI